MRLAWVAGTVAGMVAGLVACPLAAGSTRTDSIELPSPEAAKVQEDRLITLVGGRPDRLKPSIVPGKVRNDERVLVGLSGDGGVRTVSLEQRLDVLGVGDYAIRERGPAREATSLGSERPPLTQRGAVVWQGFTPGHRTLAARLKLDPQIEARHLPVKATVTFTGAAGRTGPLGDGGAVPGPGTAHVTIANITSQPQQLPTGTDAPAAQLAGPLDLALRVARHPGAARLPSTDDRLPKDLAVIGGATVDASQGVPLRLSGRLRLVGTTGSVTGPATTTTSDGATFAGTLGGSLSGTEAATVTFDIRTDGPGRLELSLDAVSALNAQELAPPRSFATWRQWAASRPPVAERKAALDTLIAVAATGARASSYSPYLGADLAGTGSTSYALSFAPPAAAAAGPPHLRPRWGALSLAGAGILLLLGAGYAVWRRS
jgi:hypothetical protein